MTLEEVSSVEDEPVDVELLVEFEVDWALVVTPEPEVELVEVEVEVELGDVELELEWLETELELEWLEPELELDWLELEWFELELELQLFELEWREPGCEWLEPELRRWCWDDGWWRLCLLGPLANAAAGANTARTRAAATMAVPSVILKRIAGLPSAATGHLGARGRSGNRRSAQGVITRTSPEVKPDFRSSPATLAAVRWSAGDRMGTCGGSPRGAEAGVLRL